MFCKWHLIRADGCLRLRTERKKIVCAILKRQPKLAFSFCALLLLTTLSTNCMHSFRRLRLFCQSFLEAAGAAAQEKIPYKLEMSWKPAPPLLLHHRDFRVIIYSEEGRHLICHGSTHSHCTYCKYFNYEKVSWFRKTIFNNA